jgi:hypothetical protein
LGLGLWLKHCPKNEKSAGIGQNYTSRNKKTGQETPLKLKSQP